MRFTLDDFQELRNSLFHSVSALRLKCDVAYEVFCRLVDDVEPRLVITETGASIKWLVAVRRARESLKHSLTGDLQGQVDEVIKLVETYLPSGVADGARRAMPFIRDTGLRRVAEGDWTRAVAAAQREDAKTVAIAAGSVVEAVALDLLLPLPQVEKIRVRDKLNQLPSPKRHHKTVNNTNVEKWPHVYRLLSIGPDGLGIISERTHAVGQELRDWRNDVHPNEARKSPEFTAADGRLAIGFAEKVLEEVEAWYSKSLQANPTNS